jgi:hypothetical protein
LNWLKWDNAGLIETGLVFGLVIAWALWDLIKTKREIRADKTKTDTKS